MSIPMYLIKCLSSYPLLPVVYKRIHEYTLSSHKNDDAMYTYIGLHLQTHFL